MGLLASVHRRASDPMEERLWTGAPSGWFEALRDTGVHVTPERAMSLSAIWAGTTFLARNIASVPAHLLERFTTANDKEGKRRAKADPLYRILRWFPNRQQTAVEYYEMAIGHVVLRGNFYARKVPGPRTGYCDELMPIHPDRVTPERLPSGQIRYIVRGGEKGDEVLDTSRVHHVRGFGSDGVSGLSLVAVAARSIGSAIAHESYAARFVAHGASASLSVTLPDYGQGDDENDRTLHQSIMRYLAGQENVGGVLMLPAGATAEKIGINPVEAQLLPSREHIVREVARWLGLPTIVLADAGKEPTHASSEVFRQMLVSDAFRPMATRFEQAILRDVILEEDWDRLYVEFLLDALARGDMKARGEFYKLMTMISAMTPNEVRDKENMNPGPDELDEFQKPMNMGFVDDPITTEPQRTTDQNAARFGVRATLLATELAQRLVRKEMDRVTQAAKKHASDGAAWSAWLREFYTGDYVKEVASTLRVPMAAAREYAARQGLALEQQGIGVMEDWLTTVTPDLAALALGDTAAVEPPKARTT